MQTVPAGSGPFDNLPAISPDRTLIAYTTAGDQPRPLGRGAGRGEKMLTIDGNPLIVSNDARATWSPDGTRLGYVANRNGKGRSVRVRHDDAVGDSDHQR